MSSFVNATLSDVKLLLSAPDLLDKLQSAVAEVQVPDAPKLMALAQALAPTTAPSAPQSRARQTADIIYAPVVSRFMTYAIPVPGFAVAYMQAVWEHEWLQQWVAAAEAEDWVIEQYETPARA